MIVVGVLGRERRGEFLSHQLARLLGVFRQ